MYGAPSPVGGSTFITVDHLSTFASFERATSKTRHGALCFLSQRANASLVCGIPCQMSDDSRFPSFSFILCFFILHENISKFKAYNPVTHTTRLPKGLLNTGYRTTVHCKKDSKETEESNKEESQCRSDDLRAWAFLLPRSARKIAGGSERYVCPSSRTRSPSSSRACSRIANSKMFGAHFTVN
jgi:hypothetical protein